MYLTPGEHHMWFLVSECQCMWSLVVVINNLTSSCFSSSNIWSTFIKEGNHLSSLCGRRNNPEIRFDKDIWFLKSPLFTSYIATPVITSTLLDKSIKIWTFVPSINLSMLTEYPIRLIYISHLPYRWAKIKSILALQSHWGHYYNV